MIDCGAALLYRNRHQTSHRDLQLARNGQQIYADHVNQGLLIRTDDTTASINDRNSVCQDLWLLWLPAHHCE
jgi:hypothetical protein